MTQTNPGKRPDFAEMGLYSQDPERYRQIVEEISANYPGVTLPSEYDYFVQENLLRFLIRLARYKFVARMLKKQDRVLEIGSGSGLGSMFLSQHCAHVTGMEVKGPELDAAKSICRRNNVNFVQGDLFAMPRTGQYDAVVALDVIEHMPMPEGQKLVDAMAGQLKTTGMVVIGTPSIHSYPYQSPASQASHVKCYDQDELLSLVDSSFGRTLPFSMNDEVVHTGFPKMAWYYFVLGFLPKTSRS